MYFVFRALTTFQELSSHMWLTAAILDSAAVELWLSGALGSDCVVRCGKRETKVRNGISSAGRMLVPCW